MPTECPELEELELLLNDGLSEVRRDDIAEHIGNCGDCQNALDQLTAAPSIEHHDRLPGDLGDGIDFDFGPSFLNKPVVVDSEIFGVMKHIREQTPDFSAAGVERNAEAVIHFPGDRTDDAPLGEIDGYKVKAKLDSGSTSQLFVAFDTRLQRDVAIKVLRPELLTIPNARARFEHEARAAAGLHHQNIVAMHEVGSPEDFPPYIVMELVNGQSLSNLIEDKKEITPRESARIAAEIADGLGAAHEAGLIHRDVKSSNVLVENGTGHVKIVDFGLARAVNPDARITVDGTIAGTPAYMSPEQIRTPDEVDACADVYSLGVVLYECLTGVLPYRGVVRMVLTQILTNDPQPPRRLNDRIPRDLENICLKAMAREMPRRYQSAAEFAEDLRRFLNGEPVKARPLGPISSFVRWSKRRPVVAGLSVVLGLVLGVGFGGLAWFNVQLRDARDAAFEKEQNASASALRANDQLRLALQTINLVIYEIENDLRDHPELRQTRVKLLESVLGKLDDITMETNGRAEQITVVALNRLGELHLESGDVEKAEQRFLNAMRIADQLVKDYPSHRDAVESAMFTYWHLGQIALDRQEPELAIDRFSRAKTLSDSIMQVTVHDARATRDAAVSRIRHGHALLRARNPESAMAEIREAVFLLKSINADSLDAADTLATTSQWLRELANIEGDDSTALEELLSAMVDEFAESKEVIDRGMLAEIHLRLGDIYERNGAFEKARDSWLQSTDVLQELVDDDAPPTSARRSLAESMSLLGRAEVRLNNSDAASKWLNLAADQFEKLATGEASEAEFEAHFHAWNARLNAAVVDAATGRLNVSEIIVAIENLNRLLPNIADDRRKQMVIQLIKQWRTLLPIEEQDVRVESKEQPE